MIKYMMCFLILTSCAKSKQEYGEFEVYINQFISEAASRGLYINEARLPSTVKLTVLKDYTLGVCKSNGTIEINSRYWPYLSSACREQLLMHELGHCTLNLGHSQNGIMTEAMLDFPRCINYTNNRTAFLDLLFGGPQ